MTETNVSVMKEFVNPNPSKRAREMKKNIEGILGKNTYEEDLKQDLNPEMYSYGTRRPETIIESATTIGDSLETFEQLNENVTGENETVPEQKNKGEQPGVLELKSEGDGDELRLESVNEGNNNTQGSVGGEQIGEGQQTRYDSVSDESQENIGTILPKRNLLQRFNELRKFHGGFTPALVHLFDKSPEQIQQPSTIVVSEKPEVVQNRKSNLTWWDNPDKNTPLSALRKPAENEREPMVVNLEESNLFSVAYNEYKDNKLALDFLKNVFDIKEEKGLSEENFKNELKKAGISYFVFQNIVFAKLKDELSMKYENYILNPLLDRKNILVYAQSFYPDWFGKNNEVRGINMKEKVVEKLNEALISIKGENDEKEKEGIIREIWVKLYPGVGLVEPGTPKSLDAEDGQAEAV